MSGGSDPEDRGDAPELERNEDEPDRDTGVGFTEGLVRGTSRGALGAALTAGIIVAWSLGTDPPDLGFAGIPLSVGSILVVVILAFRRTDEGAKPGPGVGPLLLSGGAAAAVYWWRVWSHPMYGLEGVPLMLFFAFGFWWPGVVVALGARLADRGLRPMRLRTHVVVVVAAVGGAALGAGAYKLADEVYYERHDRVALDDALSRIQGRDAPMPHGASVTTDHRGSTLGITLSLAAVDEGSYELLDDLYEYLETARSLLRRKDTDTLRVRVALRERTLATLRATDADHEADRPLETLVEIDRAQLPGGGEPGSIDLAAMIRHGTLAYDLSETGEPGPQGFRSSFSADSLRVVFRPPDPPTPRTVTSHSAAWAATNHVIRSTVRYFPEIRAFQLELPGLDTALERGALTGDGTGKLQRWLPPGRRVLALEVRTLSPEPTGPEPADATAEGFQPERFCPGQDRRSARIAVVREHGDLTDHLAVDLFERVPIHTGPLILTDVRPDGTVTAFTGPWAGPLEGPVSVAPDHTGRVTGEEIANLGWIAPEAVTCHGRPVFGDGEPAR